MSDDTSSNELRQLAFVAENYVDRDAFARAAKALDARDAEIARLRSALRVIEIEDDLQNANIIARTALQGGDDEV